MDAKNSPVTSLKTLVDADMPLLSWKVSTYVEFVFAAVEFSSADTFNASADMSLIILLSSNEGGIVTVS